MNWKQIFYSAIEGYLIALFAKSRQMQLSQVAATQAQLEHAKELALRDQMDQNAASFSAQAKAVLEACKLFHSTPLHTLEHFLRSIVH